MQLSLAEETKRIQVATDEMAVMSLNVKNLEMQVAVLAEENELYKRKVDEILQQQAKSEANLRNELQTQVGKLSQENIDIGTDRDAKDELAHARLKRMDSLSVQLDEIRDTMHSTQAELMQQRRLTESLEVQIAALSGTLEESQRDLAESRRIITERDSSLSAAQKVAVDAGREIIQLNAEVAKQLETAREQAASAEAKRLEQQGEISRLEKELDSSTAELEELTLSVKEMTDAHVLNRSLISQLESSKHELIADLHSSRLHEQEELKLRHQLAHARHDIKLLTAQVETLAGEANQLQLELKDCQSELDRTTVKLVMEEEARSRDLQRLDGKLLEMARTLEDTQQHVRDMKALLRHQKIAAEVVHSVLDSMPEGSVGISLEAALNSDEFPVVRSVSPYSSAAMSLEIEVGDVLTNVDGVSLHGRKVSEVLEGLRGAIGTHVIVQGTHPDGNKTSYVVSLSRGAQNHSLSMSRPGENYDAVAAKDVPSAHRNKTFVMNVANMAMQTVCLLAFQHSIAKRIFLIYERLDPDSNNEELDVMHAPYIKDLGAANEALAALKEEYASWCNRYVTLETQEDVFGAFVAFQTILQNQPFVNARFTAQV